MQANNALHLQTTPLTLLAPARTAPVSGWSLSGSMQRYWRYSAKFLSKLGTIRIESENIDTPEAGTSNSTFRTVLIILFGALPALKGAFFAAYYVFVGLLGALGGPLQSRIDAIGALAFGLGGLFGIGPLVVAVILLIGVVRRKYENL